MMLRRMFLAAAAGLLVPVITAAQIVRGVVVELGEVPVPGVVVQLLDGASAVVARVLSNERGEFQVAAAHDGDYRLHTLRIGFRSVLSELIPLIAGRVVTVRVVVTDASMALDTVRVVGKGACRRFAGDTAAATFAVWEQARTALTATDISTSARAISATTVTYERTLDPSGKRVLKEHSNVQTAYVAQPWRTPSPDSLHRVGYVVAQRDSAIFWAPGLETLLSGAFIEDHCFHLESSPDASRIGIAFEPNPDRRGASEIRGTLWLDRPSSELRALEFQFVNVAPKVGVRNAGGTIEFVRMTNGAWAISRWRLRMSELALRRQPGTSVVSLYEKGGELTLAVLGADTLWRARPR